MKKIFTSIIFIVSSFFASAQGGDIIKINLSSLALTNISLQYEHSLSTRSSVALGLSFLPSGSVPNTYVSKPGNQELKDLGVNGYAITPEYRYYLSNTGPKGFYLAGYYRYSKYDIEDLNVEYSSSGITKKLNLNGDSKTSIIGLIVGAQILLSDNFSLDFWIAGAGLGSQNIETTATGTFTPSEQDEIKKQIEEMDLPGKITYSVSSSQAEVKWDPGIAIRGLGVCFGFRF